MHIGSPAPETMFVIITSLLFQKKKKTGRQERHLAFDALYVLTYAELRTTLWSRNNYYIYFTKGGTKRNYLALVFSQLLVFFIWDHGEKKRP